MAKGTDVKKKQPVAAMVVAAILVGLVACTSPSAGTGSPAPSVSATTAAPSSSLAPSASLNADGTIRFDDPRLGDAIAAKLGVDGGVTPDDAVKLTDLDISGLGITSLTGIEYCVNLNSLKAETNQIRSVAPLATLTALTYLDLKDNAIADVTPLSSLRNLRSLILMYNLVSDMTPIGQLVGLTTLDMWGNRLTDISPVAHLTNLQMFPVFSDNPVMDYGPILNMFDVIFANWVSNPADGAEYTQEVIDDNRTQFANMYADYQVAIGKIKQVYTSIIKDGMTDIQKEYAIINWLIANVSYSDNISAHPDIYTSFILGTAVCDIYSLSFDYLATVAGLDTYMVWGGPPDDINHAWNIVSIDGVYYQVDVTWADPNDLPHDYSFVNVSDTTMAALHNDAYPMLSPFRYPPTTVDMPKAEQSKYYVTGT